VTFCNVDVTLKEEIIADKLISKKYESYYQKNCKKELSNEYI